MSVPPTPPADLEPDSFAGRLYDMLEPLARLDPLNAWALLIYCNAIGVEFQLVEDVVRDTPDGPGWSLLLDLDRCPDAALPWLGQFVGVRVLPSSTPDEQRARIRATDGWKRGTRDAMIGAALATLAPGAAVDFRERSGDPASEPIDYAYRLTVRTYSHATPDPTATLNALLAQKPGGIVLDFAVVTGQTWQQVKNLNATWSTVKSKYDDWLAVKTDEP